MSWKNLDIKQKVELIKLGIRSGIKDINQIKQLYDNVQINDYQHPYYTSNTVYENNIQSQNQDNTLIKGMIDEFNKNKHNIPQQNIYPQNELSTERIDAQQAPQFQQFRGGGYISNNLSQALVGKVNKFKEGGYEDDEENKKEPLINGPLKRKKENSLEYRQALFNNVDPKNGYPKPWTAVKYYNTVVDALNAGDTSKKWETDGSVGQETAAAGWAKFLGLPYNEELFPVWNGDTVSLSPELEREIPIDTNLIKKDIEDIIYNRNLDRSMGIYDREEAYKTLLLTKQLALNNLRHTFKTGDWVQMHEFMGNSVNPFDWGEDYVSPLNSLQFYGQRYDKNTNSMIYGDEYGLNNFDYFLPGKPFMIRGSIPLDQKKNGGYIFPNNAFQHKFDDGGYTKHSIAKGDTLSDISRKYNVKMDAILTANPDIKDPNLIYAGDNIYIPKKVQNFIPKEEIPRRNEQLQEITDYSKDFDYIIEGEKIYYSRKGKNNYVDISHNEKARRNLFNHIAKKEFNGYNNGEKEIYEKIKNNTYSYEEYNPHSNYDNPIPGYEYVSTPNGLELRRKKQVQELEKEEKVEKTESVSKQDFGYSKEQKDYINSLMQQSSEDLKKEVEDKENSFNPFDYLELIGPGIKRMWNKHVTQGKNDPITNIDRSNWELPESAYALRPDSYVGDTVSNGDRRYIVPESIKVDDYTYGYRNRGDYSSIDSESAGITAFTSFEPYGQHVKGRNTYIGIDSQGNLKVGDESSFSDGDFLTPTFSNDIAYFMKDSDGNIVQSKSTKNPRQNQPAYALWDNGNIIEKPTGQAVNILIRKDDKKGTQYGNITGGRVLVKVGNEMRLLSGSMSDIDKEFEEMKKRNNAEYGTFYTLDNGSYNRGLRTYDSKFTEQDLKEYDRQNAGGGNFLYVKDKKIQQDQYPSDTIWTPNVRTVEDESYKKGHDIVNEVQGAVFHHTASTDPDLTGVTKLLTSKNGNSAHVVIGHGGERVVLAKPEQVTFHAGQSMHNGRDNVNDFMIGIEFQGVTQTYDKKEGKYKKGIPLTEDQINSAVEYLKPIIKQYQIPLENLVTHQQIRDSYNDYMKKTKGKQAEVKPDIHYDDYQRIINKLLEEVYYKK